MSSAVHSCGFGDWNVSSSRVCQACSVLPRMQLDMDQSESRENALRSDEGVSRKEEPCLSSSPSGLTARGFHNRRF